MDIYIAFLFGVLVGVWALPLTFWRTVMKLNRLLETLERRSAPNTNAQPIRLLGDGRRNQDDRWRPW